MKIRGKLNTEFHSEVTEILFRHETSFDTLTNNYSQLNSILQTVLIELQAIRINSSTNLPPLYVHPIAPGETSNNTTLPPHQNSSNITYDRNQTHLKMNFPTFGGNDPTGWIYKAKQYFEFKNFKDPSKALTRFKQTTTITAYQETFEKLSRSTRKILSGLFYCRSHRRNQLGHQN
ncbi:hypothetical protein ACOSQ2_011177 [Xanthoceras sorbifolium]